MVVAFLVAAAGFVTQSCSSPAGESDAVADAGDATGGRPLFPDAALDSGDGSGDDPDLVDDTSPGDVSGTDVDSDIDAEADVDVDVVVADPGEDTGASDSATDAVADTATDSAADAAVDSPTETTPDVAADVAPDVAPDVRTYTPLDSLVDVPPADNEPCTTPGSMRECTRSGIAVCRHFAVEESRCESCEECGNLNAICSASSDCDILFTCFMGRCTAPCSFETPQTCGVPAHCTHVGHPTHGICLPF